MVNRCSITGKVIEGSSDGIWDDGETKKKTITRKATGSDAEVKNMKKAVAHLVQAVKCSKPIDARHTEHLVEAEKLLK